MKTTTLALILFLTGLDLWAQMPPPAVSTNAQEMLRRIQARRHAPQTNGVSPMSGITAPAAAMPPATPASMSATQPNSAPAPISITTSAAAAPEAGAEPEDIKPGEIDFQGVDLAQVLEVYSKYVGRTLIHGPLPQSSIVLKNETPLTRTEAIQALQAVMALSGVAVINVGEKFVKVVPVGDANSAAAPLDYSSAAQLPELGSYVTHIVQLKYVKPSVMQPLIAPFAKLQNGITPLDDNGILVLRDYAENVKRMLEMIDQIDVSVPAEYISEVIPIKYALAGDIASALNSLGGSGGGSTVSVGGSAASPPINGVAPNRTGVGGTGGFGSTGNQYQPGGANPSGSTFGQRSGFGAQGAGTTPNGTPAAGTTFQQRLNAIINHASGSGGSGGQQDQIQVFGQAKIIADSRANSLLVFATRADMERIRKVINDLDVLLSQVLIEAVIIDYSLGPNTLSVGVSASQRPLTGTSVPLAGAGGYNNGQQFYDFANQLIGTNTPAGVFGNGLGGGLSYFGNIGQSWDVALTAAAADSHASIIQRPRIQTSQAKQAQFFVGDTVPYVTGNTYGSAYGNTASYSQLSVGVELDVTPFINPEGLVVMDINQEIDDLNGYTTIDNVGNIPNTIKRTLSSEIAVRDKDTVILGGFIKSNKSTSRSGVPFLMNIPLLGNLFSQRNDSKGREELIVLMRPTVLKTPEISAEETIRQERTLPGVSAAAAEESATQRKLIQAERKKELSNEKTSGYDDGFFAVPPPSSGHQTQIPTNNMFNSPRYAPRPVPQTVPPVNPNNDGSMTAPPPANWDQPGQNQEPANAAAPVAPTAPVTPGQPAPSGKDDGFFYNDTPPKP